MAVFALSGKQILGYFDVSIEAVKVGGGLLLLYIAFEMILSGQLLYAKSMRMHNPPHPGEIIRELCVEPLGLTVTEAAKALKVTRKTLNNAIKTDA